MEQSTTEVRKPDFEGKAAKAWRCKIKSGKHAAIGLWLIEAQHAHPVWKHFVLSLTHLRPVPELPTPTLYMPLATHEVALLAMIVEEPSDKYVPIFLENEPCRQCKMLHPLNFAAQMVEIEDRLAVERCENAIKEVCNGELSPDEDFRWDWAKRFGDNMLKSVQEVMVP